MDRDRRFPALIVAAFSIAMGYGMATAANGDRVVAYTIVDASAIPESLTGRPGDPEAGRRLYFDRQLTRCSGCHGSPGGPGAEADPDRSAAPSLAGLAERMRPGTIRLWLVAPNVINPETTMPGFYDIGQRQDPQDQRFGEPLLSAQDVENVLAYLMRQATE